MERKTVYVYSDWHVDATPQLMGELQIQIVRRKEIFAFEFNPAWLKSNDTRILDPDLRKRPASPMVMVDRGEIFSKGKMATK